MLLSRGYRFLAAAALPLGCSTCGSNGSGAVDGGTDSGGHGPDASASHDAAGDDVLDAGVFPDAGGDGGVGPFGVGQWLQVPNINCDQRYAVDPNVSIPPLQWQACASKRAGCQQLVIDWLQAPTWSRPIMFDVRNVVQIVGGQPVLSYGRAYGAIEKGTSDSAAVWVAQALSGQRMFAMGATGNVKIACVANYAIGSRGWVAMMEPPIGTSTLTAFSSWALPPNVSTFTKQATDFKPMGAYWVKLAVGSGPVFLEMQSPPTIDGLDLDHATLSTPAPPAQASSPIAVSDGALAIDVGTSQGVDLFRIDGSWTALTTATPHLTTAIAVDQSNALQIVWIEGDVGGNGVINMTLWTSPYATSTAGIARRKVALVNDVLGRGGFGMVANAGVVLNLVDQSTALLTRLSDGMGWSITVDPGMAFEQPLWADDSEVWIATGPANVNNWQSYDTGVFRLARSTLGAPNVLPGF